jgi:hypothetical protein
MNRLLRIVFAACLIAAVGLATPAQAQRLPVGDLDDLNQALSAVTGQYADSYVQPVTDAFGAGMNSALFRTADAGGGIVPKVDIYVGVSATGALMASSNRQFTPMSEQIQLSGRAFETVYTGGTVPTAFGSTDTPSTEVRFRDVETDQLLRDDQGNIVSLPLPPGAVDTPVAPLLIPQLGVGTFFGTDVMTRYLPETRLQGYGTVGVFGIGIRHSISQYIPMSPVDIAVQGAYNSISLKDQNLEGDVVDASGYAFNVQVSKSLPVLPVQFYGGLQYETFSSEYAYTYSRPEVGDLSFTLDQDATNSVRALAGVTVTLAVVRVNADYSLSANDVVTVGVGVQL